jgi:hypothetical protein
VGLNATACECLPNFCLFAPIWQSRLVQGTVAAASQVRAGLISNVARTKYRSASREGFGPANQP